MMTEPLIELRNVTFSYPGASFPVFQDFNYQVLPGKHVGLVGPNGCGKTTLLHLMMGLLRPQAGSIVIFGQEAKSEKDFIAVRQKVGLLFQNPDDQLFCPTVLEDVAFGPLNQGKSPAAAMEIARATMVSLGLTDFEDRVTYKLSGGEKKLVSLATVLAMDPRLLLLDEPTAGLNELEVACLIVSHENDFLEHTVKECCQVHGHCCRPVTNHGGT
jgi:cobalt/nickel transport system ATP-binding protein